MIKKEKQKEKGEVQRQGKEQKRNLKLMNGSTPLSLKELVQHLIRKVSDPREGDAVSISCQDPDDEDTNSFEINISYLYDKNRDCWIDINYLDNVKRPDLVTDVPSINSETLIDILLDFYNKIS